MWYNPKKEIFGGLMKKIILSLIFTFLLAVGISAGYTPGVQLSVDSSERFTDVENSDSFKPAVDVISSIGIMNGVSTDSFAPNESTTRGVLVTVLWRIAGQPESNAAVPFTDLTQDWYKGAVRWAYESGIMNGTGEKTFTPNGEITREMLMTMLYRYVKYKNGNTASEDLLPSFKDCGEISSWSAEAMDWSASNNIITGFKDENKQLYIKPTAVPTRADIAVILYRFYFAFEQTFHPSVRLAKAEAPSEGQYTLWNGNIGGSFARGSGEKDDPYIISSPSHLSYLAKSVNNGESYEGKYFLQTANISLNNVPWTPIGISLKKPFMGSYDGGGYTVSNINITKLTDLSGNGDSYACAGLFGFCKNASFSNLRIKNFTVKNLNPSATNDFIRTNEYYVYVGALAARIEAVNSLSVSNIIIENSETAVKATYGNVYNGGCVGYVKIGKNAVGKIELISTAVTAKYANEDGATLCSGGLFGYLYNAGNTEVKNVSSEIRNNFPTKESIGTNYTALIAIVNNAGGTLTLEGAFSNVYTNREFHTTGSSSRYDYIYRAKVIIAATTWDKKSDFSFVLKDLYGRVHQTTEYYKNQSGVPYGEVWVNMARETQERCSPCRALPESNAFDTSVWDISDLSAPKLIHK